MSESKIVIPSKDEIIKMLEYLITSNLNTCQNIGEILGTK